MGKYNEIENQSESARCNFFLCVDQKIIFSKESNGLVVQEVPEIDDEIASRICENLPIFRLYKIMCNKEK